MGDVTRAIVAYASQVRFANLSAQTVHECECHVIDTFAVSIAAFDSAMFDGQLWNLEIIADVKADLFQNPAYAFKSGIQ